MGCVVLLEPDAMLDGCWMLDDGTYFRTVVPYEHQERARAWWRVIIMSRCPKYRRLRSKYSENMRNAMYTPTINK